MKNSIKYLGSFTLALTLGAAALSAQSCAAAGHVSNAVTLSAAASGETLAAVGDSAASGVKVVAGVAAVPIWLSGAALTSGGAIVASGAAVSAEVGAGTVKGADQLWDFATGKPEQRPHVNRERAVPPLKKTDAKPMDPAPATMLKQQL
jgi:hypothetical protein